MRIISGLLVLIVCLRNGIGAEGDPELPADFVAKASTQGNYIKELSSNYVPKKSLPYDY